MIVRFLPVIMLFMAATGVNAQTRREIVRARVDSTLQARYNKVSYDTTYIGRPNARLTLKVRTNVSGNSFHVRGNVDDAYLKEDLSTDHKVTYSFGVNYHGISAGLAINPSSLRGKNKDYELNVNIYSNRISLDASYQISKTLAGDGEYGGVPHHIDRGLVNMKVGNVAGYYTFNYRRFSYPAAFTQSYIQKQSAGSWLAGFSYQGGRMKTNTDLSDDSRMMRIYVGHFGVGGGYGYNLVAGKKWLFHISALPTLILFNYNNVTIDGERRDMTTKFPDVILNERVAIVRNFSNKYFAGATLVMSSTLFNENNVDINQNKWRCRVFFGIRL